MTASLDPSSVDPSDLEQAGKQAGAKVEQSRGYRTLVAVGLVSYGVVHLLIGYLAVRVAWFGGGDASSQGALREVAQTPFGVIVLWIVAVGLLTLVLWQGIEGAMGHRDREGRSRLVARLGSCGRAIIYVALAVSAIKVATGGGSKSGQGEETVTARLLAVPFGRALVIVVGLAIIGFGIFLIIKGVDQRFSNDLDGHVRPAAKTLGVVGYIAKGIAIALVGFLFGWASITHDPQKAGGMDAALKTLREQPFGPILLTIMAVGIVCFGLYCFVWSRNAKHEVHGN